VNSVSLKIMQITMQNVSQLMKLNLQKYKNLDIGPLQNNFEKCMNLLQNINHTSVTLFKTLMQALM
jgi:DNA mismatch repair ATPase MutS